MPMCVAKGTWYLQTIIQQVNDQYVYNFYGWFQPLSLQRRDKYKHYINHCYYPWTSTEKQVHFNGASA